MPHMTFLEHHLHSRLIVMPAGFSPFSLVLDLRQPGQIQLNINAAQRLASLHMVTKNYSLTTIDGDEEV